LPGRTDNAIKNYWNSTLEKRIRRQRQLESTPRRVSSGERADLFAALLEAGDLDGLEREL
jgi:hypothetical protein